jgi:hypothetical protein
MTPTTPIKLGLDFDNTIVCYDAAIALLAEELFDLPPEVPRTKIGLREHLRSEGREPEWTAFQGELYGPGMRYAQPFEGAVETMVGLVAAGYELIIVSHRSRTPYSGKPHDLHAFGREWIANQLQNKGLFGTTGKKNSIHFLESQAEKIHMIAENKFYAFMDDLPEIFTAHTFPHHFTRSILFRQSHNSPTAEKIETIARWSELTDLLRRVEK